ncbi:MAG: ester cyclase [Rhizobiales bacterium]|nr:ester cyclase [Hyphomicrobiales bacterium]
MTLAPQIERALGHWNAGNPDRHLELYSPRIQLHGYSPEPMNADAVHAFYRMVWDALSGPGRKSPRMEIGGMFETGSMLAFRGAMIGHMAGLFLGYPAKGKPYRIDVTTMMRFEDGKVAERWSCADMLALLVQSSAVTLPG